MSDPKDLSETSAGVNADTGATADPSVKPAQTQTVRVADNKSELAKVAKAARKKGHGRVILVPVDFSAHSKAALLFASELAESMSANLIVLHVVHDPGEMPGYYASLVKKKRIDRLEDIAAEVFDDFLTTLIKAHPHRKALRKAENLMVIGLPVTRILEVVEKVKPSMVVMGSQGRTGLKHLFLGSKAEQVVHLCPVPVTIVKQ